MRSDEGAGAVAGHPDRAVARSPKGGFEIGATGQSTLRARPCENGWRIDENRGPGEAPSLPGGGWLLERTTAEEAGFVLRDADEGAELGRTMPLVGAVEAGLKFLLLDDGRLFRIVRRGAREGGFELLGWDTPGAYLEARAVEGGWTLVATVAGGGIGDLTALSVLFAAEILDMEEPLGSEEP